VTLDAAEIGPEAGGTQSAILAGLRSTLNALLDGYLMRDQKNRHLDPAKFFKVLMCGVFTVIDLLDGCLIATTQRRPKGYL